MVDTRAASLIAEAVLKGITVSGLLGRRQRKILTVPRLVQTTGEQMVKGGSSCSTLYAPSKSSSDRSFTSRCVSVYAGSPEIHIKSLRTDGNLEEVNECIIKHTRIASAVSLSFETCDKPQAWTSSMTNAISLFDVGRCG
jgi:hypothetical protein